MLPNITTKINANTKTLAHDTNGRALTKMVHSPNDDNEWRLKRSPSKHPLPLAYQVTHPLTHPLQWGHNPYPPHEYSPSQAKRVHRSASMASMNMNGM